RRRWLRCDRGWPAQSVSEAESRRNRKQEAKRQRQNGSRRCWWDRGWRQAEFVGGACTEAEERHDRSQKAGEQSQSGDRRRQLRCDRGRSAQAVGQVKNHRNRKQEAKRQRQDGSRPCWWERGRRQAESVVGADIEDRRKRSQEIEAGRQSGFRQRGRERSGRQAKAGTGGETGDQGERDQRRRRWESRCKVE